MAADTPAAEVAIDESLVRALLAEQHPDLAGLSIGVVGYGWDNAIFRIGADLVARLPRRQIVVPGLVNEQRWLPTLAASLPLPISAHVALGRPGCGYPWPWSICPWFDGVAALRSPPFDLGQAADTIGAFLRAMHQAAPTDAPSNPWRGVPLAHRVEAFDEAVGHLDGFDPAAMRARFDELAATPAWTRPPVWLQGDMHPGNLIVSHGRIVAVIDFIDLCQGDPASDLSIAWMLFPPELRPRFWAAAGVSDDPHTQRRAQGWALALGAAIAANTADDPTFERLARRTIAQVMAD